MTGKRKKDQDFYDLHETLSDLSYLVEDYLKFLEVDPKTGDEMGSSVSLTQDLKLKIDTAKALQMLIDDNIWPKLMRIASTSSSISHRRSGGFF